MGLKLNEVAARVGKSEDTIRRWTWLLTRAHMQHGQSPTQLSESEQNLLLEVPRLITRDGDDDNAPYLIHEDFLVFVSPENFKNFNDTISELRKKFPEPEKPTQHTHDVVELETVLTHEPTQHTQEHTPPPQVNNMNNSFDVAQDFIQTLKAQLVEKDLQIARVQGQNEFLLKDNRDLRLQLNPPSPPTQEHKQEGEAVVS